MTFINRQIETKIRELLPKYPIIAVTGPRQSGKTTLLKNIFPDYRYVSLEDPSSREFAQNDPISFLKAYNDRVIFDEAQRVPELFSYLQTTVDNNREMGQFILSGSQNFHLIHSITQSLAGRVGLFRLLPFDFIELKQANLLTEDWRSTVVQGFYPTVFDRGLDPAIFYSNYIQTYLDRDVSTLTNVQDLRRFRNFLALCATRTGQLLNLSQLANECGISQPTAKSWLSILETSYVLFQLPPYFENFSKRIVKTPKIYFYDTGLASFLLGIRKPEDLNDMEIAGSLFENMIVAEFIKQNQHQNWLREFWFWRDSNGMEVDLMTKNGLKFDMYEIKSSQTVQQRFFKNLDDLSEILKEKAGGKHLIYGGIEHQQRTHYDIRGWQIW